MFVDFKGSIFRLILWQWRPALFFLVAATIVASVDHFGQVDLLRIPPMPLAIVGGAIGIFVSFRSNAGYDRWWEGRKLWGGLVNTSRHFATQVISYVARPEHAEVQRRLVLRHVAYVHTLRCLLRGQDPIQDRCVQGALSPQECAALAGESNATHALLQRQLEECVQLADEGALDPLRMQSFDESIRRLLDIQGGCERIAKTPFPPGYGYVADQLILAMGILLPMGLVSDLSWFAIPTNVLVCLAFRLIGEVGRTLETPFSTFWPALPLFALSRTIEANLRQRLGDDDLPSIPQPDEHGILM